MGIFRQFPYSNFHEMNMDEIIKIIKNMLEEWAQYHAEWDAWMDEMEDDWSNYQEVMNEAWQNMQNFINNYFDNLDVQEEINNKIVSMIQTGEFGLLINEYIPPAVNAWLNLNITEPTGVVIDTSLSVAGACADAKATGDEINAINNRIEKLLVENNGSGLFEQGSIYSNSGLGFNNANNIRTINYIKDGCVKVKPINNYKIGLYAYTEDDEYVGNWTGTEYNTSTTIFVTSDELEIPTDEYKYKVILNNSGTPVEPSEATNAILYYQTDDKLLLKGKPADAYTVGKKIDNIESTVNSISDTVSILPVDVRYIQTRNIYDGDPLHDKSYDVTGNLTTSVGSEATHIFDIDPTKEYNVKTNDDYPVSIYVALWEPDDDYARYYQGGGNVYHVGTGYSKIAVVLNSWNTTYPGIPAKIMIWEDEVSENYTEWLADNTVIPHYYREKQLLNDDNLNTGLTPLYRASFDDKINLIAYSTVYGSTGSINTAEHFTWCAESGKFTALKCDLQPTSDGKLICCHDVGFTLDNDGHIIEYDSENDVLISSLTYDECIALQYAGTMDHVCGFETFIQICKKYGMIAFVTIRDQHISDIVAPVMLAIIKKYSMKARSIINSFTDASLKTVRSQDSNIMLSHVLGQNVALTTDEVDFADKLGNCLVNMFSCNTYPFTTLINSASALAYAISKDIRVYEAQLTGSSVDHLDELISYGIVGIQCAVEPN